MKTILQFFVLFLCVNIYAQNSKSPRGIKDILSNPFYEQNENSKNGYSQKNSKRITYDQIVEEADAYFKNKYPNLGPKELTTGEFRDGEFVKYQRWKSFWKSHLNSDRTLADYTKPAVLKSRSAKKRGTSAKASCNDSDFAVNWSEVNYNGNFGYQIDMGRVSSLAFHPTDVNTYYVGAAFGGLWKTTNGGQSYTNVNDDLPHTAIADIIIDAANPNRIFIALSDIVWYGPTGIGIYESTDGGVTFSPTSLTFTLPQNVRIYEMDVNPNDASEFLVATSNGLYRTTNYFTTTSRILNQHTTAVKYNLNSNDAHAGGSQGEYYLSTNNGQTFTLDEDFGNGQVRISVSNRTNSGYVAITSANNLNVSTDYGRNFTRKSLPEQNCVVMFGNNSDTNLMVGNFECYRSTNTGTNFQATSQWLGQNGLPFVHVDQRNIYRNPLESDYVYYCNDGGVFKYSISGNNFTNLSSDLFITQYYDIAVSQTDANVLGGGSQDNGNVTRNSNGQWQSYYPTADGMGQEIDFTDSNTRYYAWQNGNVFRWVSGAVTNISPPGKGGRGAWETPYKLDPNNASRIIIGYDNVYASDDKGNTWTNIGDNVAGGSNLEQIAIAKSNSNKIYASRYNTVYAKNTANNNWNSHATPVNQYIADLEVHPTDENTVFISYSGFTNSAKVYKSTNGGTSWQNISYNLPNLPVLSLETYDTNPGAIFVGTYGGIYYLADGATQWQKYGCLPFTSVNDIEIQYLNGDKIFIGTHGRGMYEAPLSILQCSAVVTPYVNDGTAWSQQNILNTCPGTNIQLGMQNVGMSNVRLEYPNGTIDTTPDGATSWNFNNIQINDSGTYTVYYDNGDCEGQAVITLNVLEPTTLTPYVKNDGNTWSQQNTLEACPGTTIELGSQALGTENLEIKHPDGTTDNTPDQSTSWRFENIQPSDAGEYVITYNKGTCYSSEVSITLTVLNLLEIAPRVNDGSEWLQQNSLEVCEGTNISIGMQDIGTENVELIYPDGTIDNTPDAATSWNIDNIQSANSGNYTIRYNDPVGQCGPSTREINVAVRPSTIDLSDPIQASVNTANFNAVNEGETITAKEGLKLDLKLSPNLSSGTILWTGPDGATYITNTVSFSTVGENDPRIKGLWSAQITFTDECLDEKFTSKPQEVSFNVDTILNTDPSDESSYTIWPNPFGNSFKLLGNFGDHNNSFSLFDIRRRLIKKWDIRTIENAREIDINLSDIKSGLYFFVVENKNIKLTKKILKR